MTKTKHLFAVIGPGILVAATGIGAGDLATAAFTGTVVGLPILWAVVLAAGFKYVLNEGLARWQLATGTTLVEGCFSRFGKPAKWVFLIYLFIWSFLVAAALLSAVGVTCHAIYPLLGTEAAQTNKIIYGIAHSLLAVVMVQLGGYQLFEKVMSVCIGVMFIVVLMTAGMLCESWPDVARGLVIPSIPAGGLLWTIALMGGVGGTVTVLSYGYWIRENGRTEEGMLKDCRIDLGAAYVMTALFGVGMVIVGNSLADVQGGGASLIVDIANQLQTVMGQAGPTMKWVFLIGAWGAVFSSWLGVCQGIPYLFADVLTLGQPGYTEEPVDTKSIAYVGYLYAIAVFPIVGLIVFDFQTMQQMFAVVGAIFVPALAFVLLVLNGNSTLIGPDFKNAKITTIALLLILLFFVFAGGLQIRNKLFKTKPKAAAVLRNPVRASEEERVAALPATDIAPGKSVTIP